MFGKSRTETLCVMSWYTNWTPDQRQQLRRTIAQLETGPNEEDLLFGMNSLGLQHGDGPDMFECQLKMFSGWWKRWSQEERQHFIQSLDQQQ